MYFFDPSNPLAVYCLSCCVEDAKYVSTVLQILLILADFVLQFCRSYLRSIEGLNSADIEVYASTSTVILGMVTGELSLFFGFVSSFAEFSLIIFVIPTCHFVMLLKTNQLHVT